MKRVVVIGGGTGTFNVLKGLKNYPVEITAIVTTFDSGGSTGILRDEFGALPAGDIRRCLIALSPDSDDSVLRDLFTYRFAKKSSLSGHSFGNLLLKALTDITGSHVAAIKKASQILNIKGTVLPVSLDHANICVHLEDGTIITGETNIDRPQHNGALRITDTYLDPRATIYREAYDALIKADMIVIGPGDLYTSLIPNLLVDGFVDAIAMSSARIVHIMNLMTKWGETDGYVASGITRILLEHLGRERFDAIICNNEPFRKDLITRYREENAHPLPIDEDLNHYGARMIHAPIIHQSDIIRHDAILLARTIMTVLSDSP